MTRTWREWDACWDWKPTCSPLPQQPSTTTRFARLPGRLVGSGPALLFILTQPDSLEEGQRLPLCLPGGSALSGEQLPDTLSSKGSVCAHRPPAAFLRPAESLLQGPGGRSSGRAHPFLAWKMDVGGCTLVFSFLLCQECYCPF